MKDKKEHLDFKTINNYECEFAGEKEDIVSFIFPIKPSYLDKRNIDLKIFGKSFLFSFDNENSKIYNWNNQNKLFETKSIRDMSIQLDSYRKYKMTILKNNKNSLDLKVFSDGERFTKMKSQIILKCLEKKQKLNTDYKGNGVN